MSWVSWVWAVIEVIGGVRVETEDERSGCCEGGSGVGWWCRSLGSLFRAIFLDMPPCKLVAQPSSFRLWVKSIDKKRLQNFFTVMISPFTL